MSNFVTNPIIESVTAIGEPSTSDFNYEDTLENEEDVDDHAFENVTFTCSDCVVDFPDQKSLVEHVRVIHKNKPFTFHCEDNTLESEDDIDDPIDEKATISCPVCVVDFPDQKSLVEHVRVIHKRLKINKPFTSHFEDDDTVENEDDHVGEKVTFACSFCAADFPDRNSLEKHVRVIHKGLKIHKCDFCQKEFFYKSHFDIHVRFHKGEKPYSCKICFKRCSTSFNLKSHLLSHNSERRFECYVCELKFVRKNALKRHLRIHTGEKPFVCPICKKEFSQSNSFKYHVSTHQTEDFVCDICNKTFSEKYRYDYHVRTHDPNYNNSL